MEYIKNKKYEFPNKDYPIQVTKSLSEGSAKGIIERLCPNTDLVLVAKEYGNHISEVLFRKLEEGEDLISSPNSSTYKIVKIWNGYSHPKKKKNRGVNSF